MRLDDHIYTVERYGFDRDGFPLLCNGHELYLLQNDAHDTQDNRVLFDITLYCPTCDTENGISGRLPVEDKDPLYHVAVAKLYTCGPFIDEPCGT